MITSNRGAAFLFALQKAFSMFTRMLPILLGVVLLSGLLAELVSAAAITRLMGGNDFIDALIGTIAGSVAAGHPATAYVLSGELLTQGVSLTAVTALIVSWVTVGIVQLPAEAAALGKRFAILRLILCFVLAMAIAIGVSASLTLLR